MKHATELTLGAVAFAVGAVTVYIVRHPHSAGMSSPSNTPSSIAAPTIPRSDSTPAPTVAPESTAAPVTTTLPGSTGLGDGFQVDGAGHLILNAHTLDVIRRTLDGKTPQELMSVSESLARELPPTAIDRAQDLLSRYQSYQQAMLVQFPPDHAPPTDEDATQLLDSMHELRVEQFGAEATQALFGEEEATQRSMAALIRNEKDQSLTPQEKATRADALRIAPQPSTP